MTSTEEEVRKQGHMTNREKEVRKQGHMTRREEREEERKARDRGKGVWIARTSHPCLLAPVTGQGGKRGIVKEINNSLYLLNV